MARILSGRLVQVSVSSGGVPKLAVATARVTADGVEGDRQRLTEIHGGPERAVCVFSSERIDALRAEGHSISPGSIGENLTVAGLDWAKVAPGSRLRVGEVELEVTRFTTPCKTIRDSFRDGFFARVSHDRFPGWSRVYCRVLKPGRVTAGDAVSLEAARSEA